MKTYKALEDRMVNIPGALVPVEAGDTVSFDLDPGEGWEEVAEDVSDMRKVRRVVAPSRNSDSDDQGGL
jgi:hypothetical protein